MRSFIQQLNEAARKKKTRDEQVEELVGKFLFGQFRDKGEWDTKKEAEAFDAIKDYVNTPSTQNKRELFKFMPLVNVLKKDFPEVLETPDVWVYRGANIKTDELKKLFEGGWKPSAKDYNVYESTKMYSYKSKSGTGIESWTTNFNVAYQFMSADGKKGFTQCMFKVNPPNGEMFMNPRFMNKVSKYELGDMEHEVIRFSKRPIKCKVLVQKFRADDLLDQEKTDKPWM